MDAQEDLGRVPAGISAANGPDLRRAAGRRLGGAKVGPYNRRHLADRALPCTSTLRSSRPTTSAASSARRIDERFAEQLGRAFGSEALAAGEQRRRRRPRRPRVRARRCRPRWSRGLALDRARRRRPRRGDDADALLRRGDARRARLRERHPGHRQPQPEGLQRLQDGAGRPRDLRRGDPAPAPAHRGRGLRARATAAPRRWTSSPSTAHRIVGDCKLARPMKIVVDSGNGIAGASAPGILRALGCERASSCTPKSTATSRTTIPIRASPRTSPT